MFLNFFAKILKVLFGGSRLRKTGYSIKGFWGETRHFNKDGVQIGYTVREKLDGIKKIQLVRAKLT